MLGTIRQGQHGAVGRQFGDGDAQPFREADLGKADARTVRIYRGAPPTIVISAMRDYSLSPDSAIPLTKARWKNRKMTAVGIMAITAMAMIS